MSETDPDVDVVCDADSETDSETDPKPSTSASMESAPEGAPPPPAGPTRESERLIGLDVVRGIAILCILPVNLNSFGLPVGGDEFPFFMSPAASEGVAYFVLHAFFQFKFITIFALLFGVGIALQAQRAHARGESLGGRYVWRNVLLAGIGLAHAWLLWYGDILFWYALIGIATFWLVKIPLRWLGVLAGGVLAVPVVMACFFALILGSMDIDPEQMQAWSPYRPHTLAEALETGPPARDQPLELHPAREVAAYRDGSYVDQLQTRLGIWLVLSVAMLLFYVWRVAGLMLLGMVVHRLGLFTRPHERRRLLGWLVAIGLLVGLPLECLRAWQKVFVPVAPIDTLWVEALHHVSSLALALGIVAAVLRLSDTWLLRLPFRALAAAGRTALTTYLGETVVCTTLFYSYGGGLFAELTRAQLWLVWGAITISFPLLALLWLRFFRFGPVEWAWRSLTYGRVEGFVR